MSIKQYNKFCPIVYDILFVHQVQLTYYLNFCLESGEGMALTILGWF
jgi:hypothetical protein